MTLLLLWGEVFCSTISILDGLTSYGELGSAAGETDVLVNFDGWKVEEEIFKLNNYQKFCGQEITLFCILKMHIVTYHKKLIWTFSIDTNLTDNKQQLAILLRTPNFF